MNVVGSLGMHVCENSALSVYWVLMNPRRHLGVLKLHTNGDFPENVLYKKHGQLFLQTNSEEQRKSKK